MSVGPQAPPARAQGVPDYRVVILGASPTVHGQILPAMVQVDQGRRTLDWLLAAFDDLRNCQVDFVSGFMANEVMKHYGHIRFHHNADWQQTGPARSLALAPLESGIATFVCYSDVVFRADIVRRMMDMSSELALAVDRQWRVRYDGRVEDELASAEKVVLHGTCVSSIGKSIAVSRADAEFAGLMRLSARTAQRLQNVLSSSTFADRDGIPAVVSFLLDRGVRGDAFDVDGQWAELNAPQDLARFVLGTKAESLERLKPLLTTGRIGDLVRFSHADWRRNPGGVLDIIVRAFGHTHVIVRSSALSEDSWTESAAGAHKSVLDVETSDRDALAGAIAEVFESYTTAHESNQVLVQEMLQDVRMSGVVMTRTHAQLAPYYVINFDDTTTRTDTVTSGEGRELKTLFLHRGDVLGEDRPDLARVMRAVTELERLVGHDALDIEFAVSADGTPHILQVRPIAQRDAPRPNDSVVAAGLREAKTFVRALQRKPPFVVGSRTSLSVMTDWNPAEIIGTKPTRLSFSLYRRIITDETWARQRAEYGYRDVRPSCLIVDILGHPYVDVRVDFNSFIPGSLGDDLAERLVDHHLAHLAAHPELHDKVEFDILFTCWSFDFEERAGRLRDSGFSAADVEQLGEALRRLTANGIRRARSDYDALETSVDRCGRIVASGLPALERAFLHIENARVYGALTFSHLARAGFVAMTLLRSLVSRGLLPRAEMEAFLASMQTVSTVMQLDARRVATGDLSWEAFVAKYGHLRPGTYDIRSPRYDQSPEEFLRPMVNEAKDRTIHLPRFEWADGTRQRLEAALAASGLDANLDGLAAFMRLATEGREYGKFVFTRDLSAALEALAEFGEDHFVTRDDLVHLSIDELVSLRSVSFESPAATLHAMAKRGREGAALQQAVCIPDQIFTHEDLSRFEYQRTVPNYVTQKRVRAPIACLDASSSPNTNLTGQIALIPNADPGFDWIFARGIVGLITMYGGVNSHMAIRMAEFELPGVTGVGELIFNQLRQARVVELDCASRRVRATDAVS